MNFAFQRLTDHCLAPGLFLNYLSFISRPKTWNSCALTLLPHSEPQLPTGPRSEGKHTTVGTGALISSYQTTRFILLAFSFGLLYHYNVEAMRKFFHILENKIVKHVLNNCFLYGLLHATQCWITVTALNMLLPIFYINNLNKNIKRHL